MKSTVSRFAVAALTAATLALPPAMASADEATAKCAPKAMTKCQAKCSVRQNTLGRDEGVLSAEALMCRLREDRWHALPEVIHLHTLGKHIRIAREVH
jgi:hypothetical protein